MAEMAISPISVINTLVDSERYFFIAGTVAMAYIGIKKRIMAMIGPASVSIIPKILGLSVAATQQVMIMKASIKC